MMYAIEATGPTSYDVRRALLWALENDRAALLEHREATQYRRWEAARRYADRRLVRRWRESVVEVGEPAPA